MSTSWLHVGGHNGPVIAAVTMTEDANCAQVKSEAVRLLHAGTLDHDPLFTRDQLVVLLPWTNVYMAPTGAQPLPDKEA